jgi:hypothetical protein
LLFFLFQNQEVDIVLIVDSFIKSAVVQDLTVGGIKNFVSESIVTYWRGSGAISNSLDVKGVRFRMYQNADKHLGYYESEQPAFFYGECETALSINVLFKTEENALHFSHLRNESITVKSPMNSLTINSCVSTTRVVSLESMEAKQSSEIVDLSAFIGRWRVS